MLTLITVGAAAFVVIMGWNLFRRFGSDRIQELNDRRRPTSRLVGRGEFVDGNRHLPVALAITQSTLFYENRDMQASIDLQWIREVEYATDLATGSRMLSGKVLRLRSQSQMFEFVLPDDMVVRWHTMLPARPTMVQAGLTAAVAG
jgi:hypothetical protein